MENEIGKRIAALRRQRGWSQVELAEKLNVSDKAVSKWENGGLPSVDLFPVLSRLFNVSIDYLMMGDGDSFDTEETEEEDAFSERELLQSVEDLTAAELNLILLDQRELYSERELLRLQERYEELLAEETAERGTAKGEVVEEEAHATARLPRNMPCPKCYGINPEPERYCQICGCDLLDPQKSSPQPSLPQYAPFMKREEPEASEKKADTALGCLFYFVALLFPVVGLIWAAVKQNKAGILFSLFIFFLGFLSSFVTVIALL